MSNHNQNQLPNPIFDKTRGHRIPADDMYKFGEVGAVVRLFYNDYYMNVPVVKIEGNLRYLDVGDKYFVQEWDEKRWRKVGVQDKPHE